MDTQISAFVSEETKKLLEEQTRATGVKKGFLIEQALRHHLEALRTLPAEVIVPPRLVISAASGQQLRARLQKPKPPTPALKKLMKDGG
ncbi:MAG: hypothetical protein ACHQ17_04895 [Polyangia bacterium]